MNIEGTLDGIGYLYGANGATQELVLSVRVTTSSSPVGAVVNLELERAQWPQVAKENKVPATVSASGTYKPTCQSFYNDGRPCLVRGACVVVTYLW